ncbi:Tm-1-like ATP-binding domain-containing protein, partial [Nonomuraea sp. MCN248]
MTVVLVGTLDTKGEEYGWLRDRLIELGQDVLMIDAGVAAPGVSYPVDHPN